MRLYAFLLLLVLAVPAFAEGNSRWSESQANEWYQHQAWLVGSNFLPADAINELEMWQADTFDPQEIDKELGWAEGLGMNTMRVFLHDLLWQQDCGSDFRSDSTLFLGSRRGIIFVLCWFCSTLAGTPIPSLARSILLFPECTIPVGYKVRARRH